MALVDDLLAGLSTAAMTAQTNKTDTQTKANTAKADADTPPGCMEGINDLDDARKSAALAHEQAGKAAALLAILLGPGLPIPVPTPAQIATATTNRDSAVQAALDADATVAAAEPVVMAAHDACIRADALAAVVQPIIDCVNAGVAAANAATKNVADPRPAGGGGPANLDQMVQRLIDAADAANPTAAGGCNEGLQLLAQAADLIATKTSQASLNKLQECTDQLVMASPGNSVITTGQQALASANTIINQANQNLTGSVNAGTIARIWRKRIFCTIPVASINVHVTDESGDDFGAGANVSVVNFPLSALLPELPSIPTGATNSAGRLSITVPLAPAPLPVPADTPAAPPGLPTTDAASLIFTVTHSSRSTGTHSSAVDHNGLQSEVEVHIPIDDTSL